MKSICFIMLAVLVVAPFQESDIKLEIGATLKSKHIPKESKQSISTNVNDSRPFIEKTVDGIKYIIAYDEKSYKIIYILTHDKDFRTSAGLYVGKTIELREEQIEIHPYWEIRGPKTKDGWHPIIGHDYEIFSPIRPDTFKDGKTQVTISGFSKGGDV